MQRYSVLFLTTFCLNKWENVYAFPLFQVSARVITMLHSVAAVIGLSLCLRMNRRMGLKIKNRRSKRSGHFSVLISQKGNIVLYMGMVPRVKCKCPVAAVYFKNHLWLSVIYARALPLKWSLSVLLFRKSDFLLNRCFVIFSPCPLLSSSDFRIAQHLNRHALI